MNTNPDSYRAAHLQEELAERLGDLDLDVEISGEVVLVTGNVISPEQQEAVSAAMAELCPGLHVRNETRLPTVAEPHPAEQIPLGQ